MTDGSSQLLDQPVAVRRGEELDVERVDAAIKGAVPGLSGLPEVREFPGGASNLTYLLRYPERELILRRPPFGHKARTAHDMRREAMILSALMSVYRYVPKVVACFDDSSILGCDFFLMEPIHGIIVRRDFPSALRLSTEETRRLCLKVIDTLIELHQIDYAAAGLEPIGKGKGYVQRQVSGWSDRYRKARTDDVGDFENIMVWLQQNMPAEDAATCIIHNDFRFDNVVLNPANPLEIIGVLDWEMATLGDPLMDLGNALAYWVQADDDEFFTKTRCQPTHLPGMLTRREVVEYYGTRTGRPAEKFDFYIVFGLFRLAVIVQQIYFRYRQGQSKNPQFAHFGQLVNYLQQRSERHIERRLV